MKLSFFCVLFGFVLSFSGGAQNQFNLVKDRETSNIVLDGNDARVVHIAAEILAKDINTITDHNVVIATKPAQVSVIAGTIGQSKWIDQLIKSNRIDVSAIDGNWESYQIEIVDHPFDDCAKAIVVAGSDRRATAYGLLEISRMIGVSPWEWWADVTPDKKDAIILSFDKLTFGSPSVKYRGLFLNDEDWGLQRWAALNYEPETGDIGPKTYAKVFELLLRLRANTIWPAMHSCTKPFYFYSENKKVADDYAIVVGTSHCEPMLCNINAEWNSKTMGEWRYDNNAETIKKLFHKRTKESAGFEGIYTMGLRGEHDSPMIVGEDDTEAQVDLLEKVVSDQRLILEKRLGKSPETVPQIFIPYKEVLKYYQSDMELPQDITLVWTDDNYGYIRQLSTPDEQERTGGAGIYYHTSYWGRPHDYLWLNSTNPVLMWEEMSKAFEFGAQEVWVLNCGDIKPHEYNIELFLDMAWDMKSFANCKGVKQHMTNWTSREFGKKYANAITDLMYEYYRLSFQRRPEFMSWSQVEPVSKTGETELSQIHYGDELMTRIKEWQMAIDQTENIKSEIAFNRQDAFFQLVYYPVIGAASMNHKWLYAYKNKFVANQGRASAVDFVDASQLAYERIKLITDYFNNELKSGKWRHMMNLSPRHLPVFGQPMATKVSPRGKVELGIALESYEMEVNYNIINSYADVLPVFNAYSDSKYFVDVFLKGEGRLKWEAIPKVDWIKISDNSGFLSDEKREKRLWVTIDWDKVPVGENMKEAPLGHDYQLIPPSYKVNSAIDFVSGDSIITIGVSVFNPKFKELENYNGFIEDKGFVSIDAENYSRSNSGSYAQWETFEGLGYSGNVVAALPRTANSESDNNSIVNNSPMLEYDFFTFNFGEADVIVQAVPTHAFHESRGVRCAVSIDDAEPIIIDFQTIGRSDKWEQNVLRNAARISAKQMVNKAGAHKLKLWMVDPGVMIDQILINFGGWKSSYAFPEESKK